MERWTTAEVAEHLEITPATWRNYYSRRVPKHNPAPMPDGWYDARTPWWYEATVTDWHASREGKGHFPRTQRDKASA